MAYANDKEWCPRCGKLVDFSCVVDGLTVKRAWLIGPSKEMQLSRSIFWCSNCQLFLLDNEFGFNKDYLSQVQTVLRRNIAVKYRDLGLITEIVPPELLFHCHGCQTKLFSCPGKGSFIASGGKIIRRCQCPACNKIYKVITWTLLGKTVFINLKS
jgi:hypothetical protein